MFKLWFDGHLELLRGKSVLHFAPEDAVRKFLEPAAGTYHSADLDPSRAELVLNIEKMAIPDETFDIIVASHVLEHVDDRKALAELHRTLKPNGIALLMVPIIEGWEETYENPAVSTAYDRAIHFGQWDHLRLYGRDFRERVRASGFALAEVTAVEPDVQHFGLARGKKVFIATKL